MFAFLAPAALKLLFGRIAANASHDWQAIPPKVKQALVAIALLVAAYFIHQHYAHKALKAADAGGYARAKAEDAAALAVLRQRAATTEQNGKAISQDTRSKNDETNRNIVADAGDVRVRGPGAARCGRLSDPAIPAGGGGHGAGGGPADAALAAVPAGEGLDLFGLPFDGAVSFAQDHDLDRAEVLSWREWYARQAAEWAKLRAPVKKQ